MSDKHLFDAKISVQEFSVGSLRQRFWAFCWNWALFFLSGRSIFEFQFENAFYGNAYPAANILCGERIRSFIDSVSDQGDPVQDLMDGPIVWYDGQSESGPRALGHRSIIADPRSIRNKDLINLYKQRQWWRPVAPIILEDFLEEWFENAYPSPYMLNNFVIRQEKKSWCLQSFI